MNIDLTMFPTVIAFLAGGLTFTYLGIVVWFVNNCWPDFLQDFHRANGTSSRLKLVGLLVAGAIISPLVIVMDTWNKRKVGRR